MKRFFVFCGICAALGFAISCASTPSAKITESAYDIIDHSTMAYGGNTPDWVLQYPVISRTAFAEKYFPGKAVFIVTEEGNNLNSLKTWANRFSINSEVTRVISTKTADLSAAAEIGAKGEDLSTFMKSLSTVISKAEFSGFVKEQEYWLLKKWKSDGRELYEYVVVYAVDKKRLEDQINGIINSEAKATVKQDVTDAMSKMIADEFGL